MNFFTLKKHLLRLYSSYVKKHFYKLLLALILSFVVAGGEAAREIIKQHRPKAVIAVACERDLVAGIKDVRNLMVLGVPNKRPEGPCKNTCIDLKRFENSIRLFLGLSSNVSI